ncbi:hypothetical protein SynNOUM97013_01161 [Synechococcus sp. NOUM97013]|nr:hypothetical protein SynNOUM97013_01161 [Synechococcus sp. NOUM97013]
MKLIFSHIIHSILLSSNIFEVLFSRFSRFGSLGGLNLCLASFI